MNQVVVRKRADSRLRTVTSNRTSSNNDPPQPASMGRVLTVGDAGPADNRCGDALATRSHRIVLGPHRGPRRPRRPVGGLLEGALSPSAIQSTKGQRHAIYELV